MQGATRQVKVMVKLVVTGAAVAAVMTSGVVFAQRPPQSSEDQMRARQRVVSMEAILENAVTAGAESVIFQVRNIMGDQPRLLGAPRARGIRLNEYGMFFTVDVPSLILPILWPIRGQLVADARATDAWLAELRLTAAQMEDPRSRAQLEETIARLQAQGGSGPAPDGLRRNVAAASVGPETARTPQTPVARPPLPDPEQEYREQVKTALLNAMLENSSTLTIGPEEWLTVAARRAVTRDPLFPGDTIDSNTWIARVKGSVLAALRAEKITLDDARRQVEQVEQ
jgi:hypothetical protein